MSYAPVSFAIDPPIRINLFSDTQTQPTRAMREAMLDAVVGDEQLGADPTINRLCERMAALLGKDAAMFLPTGTMCNQIALLTHCRPGDAVLAHESAHIIVAEGGGGGALAGVQITPLPGAAGQFDVAALEAALLPASRYTAPQRLLEVEQTANIGGGSVWPLSRLRAVAALAHARGLSTHMDGARLMNAVVASGVTAAEMADGFDSVWLDFTKGLGAPLGAVLAGSAAFIGQAWIWKQRLGGSLRQGGMCAAACLHALDHHVARLAEDHANAARLARALSQVSGLSVTAPETNLVYFESEIEGLDVGAIAAQCRAEGLLISVLGKSLARVCTHLDVSEAQIDEAAAIIARVVRRHAG